MPFNFFKSKDNVDYKARLERKMCVAREAPEPIFDLSECNLKTVPSGVYSLCKVLRKEALFLQNNVISTISTGGFLSDLNFIKVLDLSCNKLSRLPDEIGCLELLEDLAVEDNVLVGLPTSVGKLKCLKKLNLRRNKLKNLPDSLNRCRELVFADFRDNPHLLRLPNDMGRLIKLETLMVDDSLQNQRTSIGSQGVDATIAFLQSESGGGVGEVAGEPLKDDKSETDFFLLQEKLKLIELRKEKEKNERLAWEKSLIEESERKIVSHEEMKLGRTKLIEDIKILQNGVEEELSRIQKLKDVERSQLILRCLETEERMSNKVGIILENARRFQDSIAQMTDKERAMEEELLFEIHKKNQNVEKSRILDAMKDLVLDELAKAEKFKKYDDERLEITKNWVNEESKLSVKLQTLVGNAKSNSQSLAEALLIDEELQKAAVASLLEQSDTRTWNLARQVSSIEAQLAEVTRLEMVRRKIEQDEKIVELSASRIALTELLLDLFAQQQDRRRQLVEALKRMEGVRGDDDTFWLEQYQRLLESNSRQLMKNMKSVDNLLHVEMANYGVSHFLPILAEKVSSRIDVALIKDQDLIDLGVTDQDDRILILKAFKSYLDACDVPPSAPMLLNEASAPPLSPIEKIFPSTTADECVICMENTVDAIFIPCGHMCCCLRCARLDSCPICRSAIARVLHASVYQ